MGPFAQLKGALVESTGLAKDTLHVYVALVLFIGACLVLGWKARSWKPWLLVLAAAVAGEAWDWWDTIVYHGPIWLLESPKDIANTMFWPTVLMLCARFSLIFDRSQPDPTPPA